MEALVRKYQQKYRKAKDEMARWDELQSRMVSHFGNAAAVIERLEVLREPKCYGGLTCVNGIKDALLGKQLETLERIFSIMKDILKQFHTIVISLDKISRDGNQLLKSGSTPNALQIKIGIKPSLAECVDGLKIIHEIYQSEYLLKLSLISALTWNSSTALSLPVIPAVSIRFIVRFRRWMGCLLATVAAFLDGPEIAFWLNGRFEAI